MLAARVRFLILILLAAVAWVWWTAPGESCPFCAEERGPTLIGDFNQAAMVLVGQFTNPRIGSGGIEEGKTDFAIDLVLKAHEVVKDKKTITLPRYVNQLKSKFIVFCDVYKGQIDPYRGIELPAKSEMVKYLSGAVALKDKPVPERLRYCFDFLNSTELDVALDAYREYAKADYKDYQTMARKLPADTIAEWLRNPKTPPYRFGLYASLMGHCGGPTHAKLLRELLDDPQKRQSSGIDGMLAAYIMLASKDGWNYVKSFLGDEKQEFLLRYAALRTVRFMWEQRPDLIDKKDLVQGLCLLLDHGDMADFAIEDLRKWQRWEMTERVLDLFSKKTHDVPVVRRAVLRFALRSPDKRAADFVQQQRKRDVEWVRDTEELLKLEDTPSK